VSGGVKNNTFVWALEVSCDYTFRKNIFFFIFRLFTICFEEAVSKLFECLHVEWRCCSVTVLRI